MKLLQWVHRKLRQNSIDPFTLGNPCSCLTVQPTLDNPYSRTKPSFSSNKAGFLKPRDQESQTYYSGFNDNRLEETHAVIPELFEGFLTIGTLGAETVTYEPATPTFAMPMENSTNTDPEVTENELKFISSELEKFLDAEKESLYESPGRNSRVSNITLGGKQTDGSEAEDFGNKTVCPLQGYLLGSSFELQEKIEVRKERASLAELFHRTKTTDEDSTQTGVREIQVNKEHKPAMHIMKKMLKMVHSSPKSSNTSENDADAASTNKKFHKVKRMFHRKVYPENTIDSKKITTSHNGKKENPPRDCFKENDNGDTTNPDHGRRFHSDSKSREWSQYCKTNWNPPQHGPSYGGSTGNNEHWIKTDAEYLVLEL